MGTKLAPHTAEEGNEPLAQPHFQHGKRRCLHRRLHYHAGALPDQGPGDVGLHRVHQGRGHRRETRRGSCPPTNTAAGGGLAPGQRPWKAFLGTGKDGKKKPHCRPDQTFTREVAYAPDQTAPASARRGLFDQAAKPVRTSAQRRPAQGGVADGPRGP